MAINKSSTEALKKVEDQITCPICMEHFTDPRVLPCLHSYCLKCLQRVLVKGNHSLPCPTCRSPCPVSRPYSLYSLPRSFVVNNLVEVYDLMKKASAHQNFSCDNCDSTKADRYCKQCAKFFCPLCLSVHNKWKPNADHQILTLDEVASKAQQLQHARQDLSTSCTDHNKPLELFCETCQQLICHNCTVKKHEKPDHKYNLITDTYRQRKGEINQSCLHPLNEKYDRLVIAKGILISTRDEISESAGNALCNIWSKIDQQKKHLDKLGKKLTQEVDSIAQYKFNVLKEQIKEVDTAISQVEECRDRVDECVKVASPQQVLLTAQKIIKHTKTVIDSVIDKTFQPLEQPDIQLVESGTIPEIYDYIVGEIKTTTLASSAEAKILSHRNIHRINQESNVTFALSLPDGSPVHIPPSLIKCCLTSLDNSWPPIQCSVKESSQLGQYSVVFTPHIGGDNLLHVTVNNSNILGSPVSIPVLQADPVIPFRPAYTTRRSLRRMGRKIQNNPKE